MTEVTDNPVRLEKQFGRPQEIIPPRFGLEHDREISELSKQVERLREIPYVPGFENYAAYSPFLEANTPVRMRFSWGKDAPNMPTVHLGEGETADGNQRNVEAFLESQDFSPPPYVVHVIGNFLGTQYQIQEVGTTNVSEENQTLVVSSSDPEVIEKRQLNLQANFVYTRDPNMVEVIKQADCPVVIGYCQDKYGNDIAFIDHMGADAKNAGISRQGLLYLRDELGVDLSKVKVAVLPGVSKQHYDISNEPERRGNGIMEENWKEFIDPKYPDYIVDGLLMTDPNFHNMTPEQKEARRQEIINGQKRHVDILEATIVELLEAGVLAENIQAISVDSYEAAEKGESYSHRYTTEHSGKRKGRIITAVQLKPRYAQEATAPLAKAA